MIKKQCGSDLVAATLVRKAAARTKNDGDLFRLNVCLMIPLDCICAVVVVVAVDVVDFF